MSFISFIRFPRYTIQPFPSTARSQELMMLFNSHQNIQRVIETAWSFYLLKYALKVS